MRRNWVVWLALILMVVATHAALAGQDEHTNVAQVERGRYLIAIAGCNACHTPGYAVSGGDVPEQGWLTGNVIGWRGPWGTTYAGNVRLYVLKLTQDEWVKIAHTKRYRPPMPWSALHNMTAEDLRAIYQFIKYLGPAGKPGKAYVPPEQTPDGPYVTFPSPGQ